LELAFVAAIGVSCGLDWSWLDWILKLRATSFFIPIVALPPVWIGRRFVEILRFQR
jgi:hypothetical protein